MKYKLSPNMRHYRQICDIIAKYATIIALSAMYKNQKQKTFFFKSFSGEF
tara:strand:+ start:985 stop:1134 length:150 start_codon:yes stop_codon:yes gene_type:complete